MDDDTRKQITALTDLTLLDDDSTEGDIQKLSQKAQSALGCVAAVCVYSPFIRLARELLKNTPIKIATVCNFPDGNQSTNRVCEHIRQSLIDGADEIDVVLPYRTLLAGNDDGVENFLIEMRKTCGTHCLKVILETGALQTKTAIAKATAISAICGADFVKTSTGKITPGATLEAANTMLETLNILKKNNVGIKLSGGLRTPSDATPYLDLIARHRGMKWIHPQHVRFGSSRMLD